MSYSYRPWVEALVDPFFYKYYEFSGQRDGTFSYTIRWLNLLYDKKGYHRANMLCVVALLEKERVQFNSTLRGD